MISAALEKLEKAGVPIVVGAGESNEAFKQTKLGKAFLRSNVFVVTSSNKQDNLGKLANHGERSVITAAPGDKIKVLGLKNSYQEVRGTAYAAAHLVGAFVIAKSKFGPSLNINKHLRPAISDVESTTIAEGANIDRWVRSGGVISVPKLLNALDKRIN